MTLDSPTRSGRGVDESWHCRALGISTPRSPADLEQGLELAQRIGLAYVEVGCLSYLAVIDAWGSFALVRQRCGKALAIADAHGWSTDPIVAWPWP